MPEAKKRRRETEKKGDREEILTEKGNEEKSDEEWKILYVYLEIKVRKIVVIRKGIG